MSPIEKAEDALNTRVSAIQASLRTTEAASSQQALFQAMLVCLAIGDALAGYVRSINEYAQKRHDDLRQAGVDLTAEHNTLLQSGHTLLAQLKANPADKAVRKEIERTQREMEALQRKLRRGTYTLRADLAPGMALIDPLALTVRRFGEAAQISDLKRVVKLMVAHTHELYRSQPGLPSRTIVDAPVWEKAALAGIDQATEFQQALARAGYQVLLALEVMRLAFSPTSPATTDEATRRGAEAIAERMKATAGRFTASPDEAAN